MTSLTSQETSKEAGDKSTNDGNADGVARQLVEFFVLSWHHVRNVYTVHRIPYKRLNRPARTFTGP